MFVLGFRLLVFLIFFLLLVLLGFFSFLLFEGWLRLCVTVLNGLRVLDCHGVQCRHLIRPDTGLKSGGIELLLAFVDVGFVVLGMKLELFIHTKIL